MSEYDKRQEMKTFKANGGKVYPHYKRHKANAKQVELDKFNKVFKEKTGKLITKEEAVIYKTGFNSGYKAHQKRDQTPSDSCLNCGIKLGFKGFCSKDCHRKYSRKPDGHRDRASKRFHQLTSPTTSKEKKE